MSTDPELHPAESETTSKPSSSLCKNPTQTKTSSSPYKIESSDYENAGSKKISCLKRITNLFPKRGRESQPQPPVDSKDTKVKNPARSLEEEALLLEADIRYIKKVANGLSEYNNKLNELLKDSEDELTRLEGVEADKRLEGLCELHKALRKLKHKIPSNYNVDGDALKKFQLPFTSKQNISEKLPEKMPRLHKNAIFESSAEFKDVESLYNELDIEVKLCLLCFSIFPENAIIKKRLLVLWWFAEGFASEDDASRYIRILVTKGFIEPVNENRSPFVGCYRMHPFHRSVLATLAERAKFFNFDVDGKPTQNFEGSFQACLVGEGLISYEDLKSKSRPVTVDDLEKIHLLINVNEPILDFKPDWFSKMRNVNVLYLGRWKVLATDHIEVDFEVKDKVNFLDGFKNMNYMRFLSLQGVSNIITLPKSILMLKNLKILDLRACHNLEEIPKSIGFLKSLTHLDMSECYLLDHIPKSLSSLTNLRVLKGFVVGENKDMRTSCTLDDLNKLPELTKLCIYTSSKKFPTQNNVLALSNLTALRKLTIEWGVDQANSLDVGVGTKDEVNSPDAGVGTEKQPQLPSKLDLKCFPESTTPSWPLLKNLKHLVGTKDEVNSPDAGVGTEDQAQLPSKLEKLDLKCFPESTSWLLLKNLKKLEDLKKLYIRGGKFCDLGQCQGIENLDTWKVQVLRLKYLTEIKMEWKQLQELFPDLMYLEQVSCPKLTLFPTDANGIWTHPTKWEEFRKAQFND